MATITEITEVRASNLREGDRVTAIYDREARRRQPNGWRNGDLVVKGAFRTVTEYTVETLTRDGETTTVCARSLGASVATWQAPVANDTVFEILRKVEV